MFEKELEIALLACKEAMKNIMKYYNAGFHVEIKSDESPVTEADKTSDVLIKEIISKEFPNYSFLTEESDDDLSRLDNDYVFIVDPLDGTKDFVHKDDEFTVNIALSYKHKAVLGVVGVPAKNIIYYAVYGNGAFKIDENGKISQIHVSSKTEDLTCLISVFHSNENEDAVRLKYKDKITKVIKKGSSLKACLIAEGKAEISYRLSQGTKEWDTAAFQIIVEEAGGLVLKIDKTPMTYNRKDVYNREWYLIINRIENFLI